MIEQRDARTANRIDEKLRPVHYRLLLWGRFMRSEVARPRVWPSSTLLAKVMEGGPFWATAKTSGGVGDMPGHIERVHKVVQERLEFDRRLVVNEFYLSLAPVEAMAPQLRMRVKIFYNVLNAGRRAVQSGLKELGDHAC